MRRVLFKVWLVNTSVKRIKWIWYSEKQVWVTSFLKKTSLASLLTSWISTTVRNSQVEMHTISKGDTSPNTMATTTISTVMPYKLKWAMKSEMSKITSKTTELVLQTLFSPFSSFTTTFDYFVFLKYNNFKIISFSYPPHLLSNP